jgi:hypothetical protein
MNITNQGRPVGQRQFFVIAACLLVAGILSACSSGLKVRTDVDPSADFGRYQSFAFFEPLGIEGGYNSPIFGEHFRAAIGRELGQRRYRKSDNPDIVVNVTIRADDRVSIKSYSGPYMTGNYYGQPGRGYGGSSLGVGISTGGGGSKRQASVFIDFVDVQQHRVVWQGVAVVDVNDKVAQRLRDAIYTAVNKIFEQYPYTAL